MTHTITIRSRRAILGTAAVAVLGLAFEVLVLVQEGWRNAALSLPWPVVVAAFSAWLWMWPRLTLAPGGARIRNHFRQIDIPWSQLTEARSDLGLYLWVGTKKYFSAAPPARGGLRASSLRKNPPAAPVIDDTQRAHHVVDTEPVVAAQIVAQELEDHRHPERREPVPSRAQALNEQFLAEHPIPRDLDQDFPTAVAIRWIPWPALGVLALLGVAVLATAAL